MRRKDDGEIVRNVVQMLDEDGSLCLQPIHHIAVMHDLVPDIDGRAIAFQRKLHDADRALHTGAESRSGEHTSELQSLMRISYAVSCLKKKTQKHNALTDANTPMK